MIVRLGDEGDSAALPERADPVDDIRCGETRLLEERPRDRETESELGKLVEGAAEPVEGRAVRPLGDALEDRKVPVDVKVRPPRPQVQEAKTSEPPGLMEVEIENDLQGPRPPTPIAST